MRFLPLLLILLLPAPVQGAMVRANVAPGLDGARVEIFLISTSTPVNALEGTLTLPVGARVANLFIGESVVQNWIEAPREVDGVIRFAGIIPGGFTGSASPEGGLTGDAPLFSFEVTGAYTPLSMTGAKLYLNDGIGTRVAYADEDVSQTLVSGGARQVEDRIPPEYVDVERVSGESVADGGPALLLSGFDAHSGIDRFEVQEGNGAWVRSESVYAEQDEYGLRSVSVRAYDRAGNFIETRVPGRNAGYLYVGYALLGFALLSLFSFVTLYFKKHRNRT